MYERSANEILDDLMEEGTEPSQQEIVQLCHEAGEAGRWQSTYKALERALNRAGYVIMDVTTDDDDETRLEIVEAEN